MMIRNRMLVVLGFAALFLAAAPHAADCDLKTIVKGFFCDSCKLGMEKSDLASNASYFYCDACDKSQTQDGKCADCGHALAKKTSGKDVCKKCFKKPNAADLCVKQGFVCPKCFKGYGAGGKCTTCKLTLESGAVKALVRYECTDCKSISTTAGKCTKAGCKKNGQDLIKRCSESGRAPHIP